MCSKVGDPKTIPRSLKIELNTNAEPKKSSFLPIQEPHPEASYISHTLSIMVSGSLHISSPACLPHGYHDIRPVFLTGKKEGGMTAGYLSSSG